MSDTLSNPLDDPHADPFEVARTAAADIARLTGVEHHDIALTLGSGWGKAADLIGETVATIDAGGFAGEMALLTRARRDATVTARTDVTVLHLDGRTFGSLLDEAPEIAVKMLPIVAARVVDNSTHHQH